MEQETLPQQKEERRIPCEVYSRIVGYLRPVQNWHRGKQQEFQERRMFRVPQVEDENRAVPGTAG
ncbi:MAG: anaerobic ribonucleoside-triphosphate reductase [Chloroflexia bacterium]